MLMRSITLTLGCLLSGTALAATAVFPPPPPQKPVTDTYFGTTVTDPYRYFEDEKDAAVIAWMKAQGAFTRAVFDSIPGRAALAKRVGDLTGAFEFVNTIQIYGGRTFYEDRAPGSDNYDLMVRDADGRTRKLVDLAALRAAHGGDPYALNYFLVSPDGSKVAVGISAGGSEDAKLSVLDVASGNTIAGPIDRARFGATGWTDDGRTLFFSLLADLPPNAPVTDKYQNSVAYSWDLKGTPVPLLGGKTPAAIAVPPVMFPLITAIHGAPLAIALVINGTQNEHEFWTVPVGQAAIPNAPWKKLAGFEDNITTGDMSGDTLFLLSHTDAPTFKVLTLKAGQPLAAAKTFVAARPDRLIEGIGVARDGLYIRARHGLYSELIRIPLGGGPEQVIKLPFEGSIGEMFTDPTLPGATLILESWALPPSAFRYDGTRFAQLPLGKSPASFNPKDYAVAALDATAKDGVKVPLSYVEKAGSPHPRPVLLWAYGSYGISEFPYFSPRWASFMAEGINFAVCHVRGGGELGEAWRLGGKDANKPNTWRDLIACGRELVAKGYTTPKQLFIMGGSAGGITMGRAMEEAPDLFAGVFDMVPAANATRQEFSPNGVPNIPEFGTVKTEAGFRNLLAMDSYLNVKDGVNYPPILITTGLNDPRVASWEPAKLAARLQASGTKNPVLLRVDEQAGHGIGSTKSQTDELYTDSIAFILWQTGAPGWQPTIKVK
jgi:prolyl oligopeptidase